MKIKKDNGASLTGFVITILVILLIVAVVGCVYLINNPIKEKVAIQTPTNVENLKSSDKVEENVIEKNEIILNENLYNQIKGLYEYEVTEIDLGEDDNDNYLFRLQMFENGTFRYEYMPGKGAVTGFIGNYIIVGKKIVLNKLFLTGSDVSLITTNGQSEMQLNDNGTISILNSKDYYPGNHEIIFSKVTLQGTNYENWTINEQILNTSKENAID